MCVCYASKSASSKAGIHSYLVVRNWAKKVIKALVLTDYTYTKAPGLVAL